MSLIDILEKVLMGRGLEKRRRHLSHFAQRTIERWFSQLRSSYPVLELSRHAAPTRIRVGFVERTAFWGSGQTIFQQRADVLQKTVN